MSNLEEAKNDIAAGWLLDWLDEHGRLYTVTISEYRVWVQVPERSYDMCPPDDTATIVQLLDWLEKHNVGMSIKSKHNEKRGLK